MLFAWISDCYKRSLQIVLRHPAITLGVLVATIAATALAFRRCAERIFSGAG